MDSFIIAITICITYVYDIIEITGDTGQGVRTGHLRISNSANFTSTLPH